MPHSHTNYEYSFISICPLEQKVGNSFKNACFFHTGPGWRSRYRDLLRAGRSGDRIPVGARFSAPIQTGPGAHSASYTIMGTGSFPRVKRPGRGVNHPPISVPSWQVIGFTYLLLS
jgi:hypothetical protein